ncbi:MAG: Abi family protein [Candidatus Kapabacteria bacterium]|nr:Abi family protein [Candidatus Kapabacteria bacterium]
MNTQENLNSKIKFDKEAKNYDEQIEILLNRGMTFKNKSKAKFILENISYYRLSGYWYQYYKSLEDKTFKIEIDFDDCFNTYCFDKELRKILIEELEKIEVSIRAKISYNLSNKYGGFWFNNTKLVNSLVTHSNLISKINNEYQRSDELFIKSYKKKYLEELPPSWILLEVASFGSLSQLYKNLLPYDKRTISNNYKLPEVVFETWLHSFVYIRNLCAHHSRLWNRELTIKPKRLENPKLPFTNNHTNNRKIFYVVLMIKYFINIINPMSSFKIRLVNLIKEYPQIDISEMGFISDWDIEDIWIKNYD